MKPISDADFNTIQIEAVYDKELYDKLKDLAKNCSSKKWDFHPMSFSKKPL